MDTLGMYAQRFVNGFAFAVCVVLLLSRFGGSAPPPASKPVRYQTLELEFKPHPPGMCWARVKGQNGNWGQAVQTADGTWLLWKSSLQP